MHSVISALYIVYYYEYWLQLPILGIKSQWPRDKK